MEREEILREIRRLAPWYYLWDFDGVRTDTTAPCDDQGHREVFCPAFLPGFWSGKSVLDVACNEGAYGLGALEHGAARLVGFDCRTANVEKARFVARIRRRPEASFEVATCDSWLRSHAGEQFDVVLMCGILYHLRDPVRTIREFCRVARRWIYVTSCVQGVDDIGYTWTTETDNIAASYGARDSLMPNNADTLVREFEANGFRPVHLEEVCKADFWDGASLLLANTRESDAGFAPLSGGSGEVGVWLVPEPDEGSSGRVFAVFHNRSARPIAARLEVSWCRDDGAESVLDEETLELAPRATRPSDPASSSVHRVLEVEPAPGAVLRATLRDPERAALLGGAALCW